MQQLKELQMNNLLEVHRHMIHRYIAVIEDSKIPDKDKWVKYCETALTIENPDKLSRWLGCIQGILYSHYDLSIDEERDYSRDFYKPIYVAMGYDTLSITINCGLQSL
jgi:hypothetical protein